MQRHPTTAPKAFYSKQGCLEGLLHFSQVNLIASEKSSNPVSAKSYRPSNRYWLDVSSVLPRSRESLAPRQHPELHLTVRRRVVSQCLCSRTVGHSASLRRSWLQETPLWFVSFLLRKRWTCNRPRRVFYHYRNKSNSRSRYCRSSL